MLLWVTHPVMMHVPKCFPVLFVTKHTYQKKEEKKIKGKKSKTQPTKQHPPKCENI